MVVCSGGWPGPVPGAHLCPFLQARGEQRSVVRRWPSPCQLSSCSRCLCRLLHHIARCCPRAWHPASCSPLCSPPCSRSFSRQSLCLFTQMR